jgi:hypothetical protein
MARRICVPADGEFKPIEGGVSQSALVFEVRVRPAPWNKNRHEWRVKG